MARLRRLSNAIHALVPRRSTRLSPMRNGEKIPDKIINPDQFYDASNAKELLSTAY